MSFGNGARWTGGSAAASGTIYFEVEFNYSKDTTGAAPVSIANGDSLVEIAQKLADAWNTSEPVADTWAANDNAIVAFYSKAGLAVTGMAVAPVHQGRTALAASGASVDVLNHANSPAVSNVLTEIVVPA